MEKPLLPLFGGGTNNTLEALYPLMRGLATLFLVSISFTLCGTVGSLAYPEGGIGAVVGSLVGASVSLIVGCCATGLWKSFVPEDTRTFGVGALLPHSLAVQIGSHGDFDLVVTIHEASGIAVQGHMPWSRSNSFVELQCGGNPVKRTCVKSDGKFNEQFKFRVTAHDQGIMMKVMEQEMVGAASVGYTYVDIQRDVIDQSFPSRKEYFIEAGENDRLRHGGSSKARLILSFDYTEDYPWGLRTHGAPGRGQAMDSKYGAVNFLTQIEFNPNAQVAQEDIYKSSIKRSNEWSIC